MQTEIMKITSAMAQEWLKRNTRNRPLSDRRVKEYARDMQAGVWLLNGEAIKLATDGTILDGQHRLAAIVEADVALETLVVMGLPAHTQDTMDSGRRRTAGDALAINGVAYASNLAAIARRVWQWDRQNYRFNGLTNPTTTEVLETVELYPTLHRSVELAHRVATSFKPTFCTLNGVTHHLFLAIDPDQTAWFFAGLETGANLAVGHPVLALRNRLIMDQTMQRKPPFPQSLGFYIRAWNAIRESREMARIQHPIDAPMPMPV